MSSRPPVKPVLVLSTLLIASLACGPNFAAQTQPPDINAIVTQTMQALATISAATLQAGVPSATAEGAGPEALTPEASPSPSASPAVVHVMQPSNPGLVSSYMTDGSSASLASERRSIADYFDHDLYERPFTTQVMDYQNYLDLTRAELSSVSPWMYITLTLNGAPPADSTASYGVEIDLNLDGRGDWLIMGLTPPGSDWTTDGVQAWRDANGDVGGLTPVKADSQPQPGDGYETLVFDQGQGPDPDAAWIRRSPSDPSQIQLAFKHSLIGLDSEFLWGAWADEGVKQPGWFDYNDHFTVAEAGSPTGGNSAYPLKSMASLDNTCRWGFGFKPTGSEPGACYVPPTPTPTSTPKPTLTPTRFFIQITLRPLPTKTFIP
jgi:hypothetical protein